MRNPHPVNVIAEDMILNARDGTHAAVHNGDPLPGPRVAAGTGE